MLPLTFGFEEDDEGRVGFVLRVLRSQLQPGLSGLVGFHVPGLRVQAHELINCGAFQTGSGALQILHAVLFLLRLAPHLHCEAHCFVFRIHLLVPCPGRRGEGTVERIAEHHTHP